MYPHEQHPYGPEPPRGGSVPAGAWIAIAVLATILIGIVAGGLGFCLGRSTGIQEPANRTQPTPAVASPTPIPSPSATPSPTPVDISGKYSGPTGDVDISDVADKTFAFDVSVGNAQGAGHVDGRATRTSATVGTFSKI